MKYAAVTTFAPAEYEKFGRKFIESYVKHWPREIPLYVYYEGDGPSMPLDKNVIRWPLDLDQDRKDFLKRNSLEKRPEAYGPDYRQAAVKFSHKIFALTDPKRIEEVDTDWWIWLDADIETFANIDQKFLDKICPEGFVGAYLGRNDWRHSECGLVTYGKRYGGFDFLRDFREIYTSDDLFEFQEWHDSFIFDRLREKRGGWWFNLSTDIPGMHVFDDSILGTTMKHLKGPLRKKGKELEGVPEEYLSKKEKKKKKHKGPVSLIVKTKNCVKDEEIHNNIRYSMGKIERWLPRCAQNDRKAIICSGGPSLKDHIGDVKLDLSGSDSRLFCVKHSHDYLIEQGVIPWACFLLDPRSHVQDFIENPHPDILYFVASMCQPTTIDRLVEKNANIWGYHAHVGANEDKVIKECANGVEHFMLGGGCSAAMRGISVLYMLGFRKLSLYGYDLCFFEEPDWTEKDKKGEPKYLEVEVLGKKFWTDPEKVAQCQDFEKIMKGPQEMDIEAFGPGMIPHIWKIKRKMIPTLEEVFDG